MYKCHFDSYFTNCVRNLINSDPITEMKARVHIMFLFFFSLVHHTGLYIVYSCFFSLLFLVLNKGNREKALMALLSMRSIEMTEERERERKRGRLKKNVECPMNRKMNRKIENKTMYIKRIRGLNGNL